MVAELTRNIDALVKKHVADNPDLPEYGDAVTDAEKLHNFVKGKSPEDIPKLFPVLAPEYCSTKGSKYQKRFSRNLLTVKGWAKKAAEAEQEKRRATTETMAWSSRTTSAIVPPTPPPTNSTGGTPFTLEHLGVAVGNRMNAIDSKLDRLADINANIAQGNQEFQAYQMERNRREDERNARQDERNDQQRDWNWHIHGRLTELDDVASRMTELEDVLASNGLTPPRNRNRNT